MRLFQLIELTLTSFLFAFIIANLVEFMNPELWLTSAVVSFIIWAAGGFRYFYLKNEMLKHKPSQAIVQKINFKSI
jgi:hypothetical protein